MEAKKATEILPADPTPPHNQSTGLSAPFQLNSKPNTSSQRTLQRDHAAVPAIDTFVYSSPQGTKYMACRELYALFPWSGSVC